MEEHLDFPKRYEHVVDDIHTEYVGIIQPPLHSPQLLLQFLPGILLPALGQIRLELLLEVLLGLHHQLLQQLLELVDKSLLAGECKPLTFTQDVREYEGAIVLLLIHVLDYGNLIIDNICTNTNVKITKSALIIFKLPSGMAQCCICR